jgi:hypothetical protein
MIVMNLFRRNALALAIAASLYLSACSKAPETPAENAGGAASTASATPTETKAAEANEADASSSPRPNFAAHLGDLQACAYDGDSITLESAQLSKPNSDDAARRVVAEIMRFTGLPQNFEVMIHPQVPNAAAVIVLDEATQAPKRIIAYNPEFMSVVARATGNNAWAPISIMAHEVGHHLSGHTIQRGGSQPPGELEADKFSGFVLFKMGASLNDAQNALAALVGEGGSPTHPGRAPRLAAVADGWTQACEQQGKSCVDGVVEAAPDGADKSVEASVATTAAIAADAGTEVSPEVTSEAAPVGAPVAASAPTQVAPLDLPDIAAKPTVAATANAPLPTQAGKADRLPAAKIDATPAKFDKFIYDEYGYLDATVRADMEAKLYRLAQEKGAEVVTLLVRDTQGLNAQDYASLMLRQLRVGKLDVGNGAVLVMAPERKEVGIALGPGLGLLLHDYLDLDRKRMQNFIDNGFDSCKRKGNCGAWSENALGAAQHFYEMASHQEWRIKFPSFGALYASAMSQDIGADYDPEKDPSYNAIAQLKGKVLNLDAKNGNGLFVNDVIIEQGFRAVQIDIGDGFETVLYVRKEVEMISPSGPLKTGMTYHFVAQNESLSHNKEDTQSLTLLSYDQAQ